MQSQSLRLNCPLQQINTYQVVLARYEDELYCIFLYADGLVQWAALDGYFAQVDFFHRINWLTTEHFRFPGSGTCSIIHIASRSNVGIPGMFVFRGTEIDLRFGNYY